jgi:hypothetical protein
LATCLAILHLNKETNWAAKRAKAIVEGLMGKLNVVVPGIGDGLDVGSQPSIEHADLGRLPGAPAATSSGGYMSGSFSPSLDIDAILQSFVSDRDQTNYLDQVTDDMLLSTPYQREDFGDQVGLESGIAPFHSNQAQTHGGQLGQLTPSSNIEDILFGFNDAMIDDVSF